MEAHAVPRTKHRRSHAKARSAVGSPASRRLLSAAADASSLLDSIHASSLLVLSPSASTSSVSGLTPSAAAKAYGFDQTSYGYHFTTPAGHQGVTFVAATATARRERYDQLFQPEATYVGKILRDSRTASVSQCLYAESGLPRRPR